MVEYRCSDFIIYSDAACNIVNFTSGHSCPPQRTRRRAMRWVRARSHPQKHSPSGACNPHAFKERQRTNAEIPGRGRQIDIICWLQLLVDERGNDETCEKINNDRRGWKCRRGSGRRKPAASLLQSTFNISLLPCRLRQLCAGKRNFYATRATTPFANPRFFQRWKLDFKSIIFVFPRILIASSFFSSNFLIILLYFVFF